MDLTKVGNSGWSAHGVVPQSKDAVIGMKGDIEEGKNSLLSLQISANVCDLTRVAQFPFFVRFLFDYAISLTVPHHASISQSF